MSKAIRSTSGREAATSAGVNTALMGVVNSLTGAYEDKPNKHRLVRSVAPLADDAAILALNVLRK